MKQSAEVFSILLDIAKRSQSNAYSLPAETESVAYWSGIGFKLLNKQFVAPIGEVSELLQVPSVTKLPGVKSWVMGVANVRGRLLPIIDMGRFLGGKLVSSRKKRRVLVVELNDLITGLVVDEISGMQHFPADQLADQSEHIDELLKPYVKGVYGKGGDHYLVFSIEALTQDEKFYQVGN